MTTPVPETTIVTDWRVSCDGSGPALGHPRVWYSIPHDRGWVECGYCDRRFVHADFAQKAESTASGKAMGPAADATPADGPTEGDNQPG